MSLVCVHIVLTAQGAVRNRKPKISKFIQFQCKNIWIGCKIWHDDISGPDLKYRGFAPTHTHCCCHLS